MSQSLVQQRHRHRSQSRRVAKHLDGGDFPILDREGEDHPRLPARRPDQPHRAVDERWLRIARPSSELPGHRVGPVRLSRGPHARHCVIGPQRHLRVEDSQQSREIAIT